MSVPTGSVGVPPASLAGATRGAGSAVGSGGGAGRVVAVGCVGGPSLVRRPQHVQRPRADDRVGRQLAARLEAPDRTLGARAVQAVDRPRVQAAAPQPPLQLAHAARASGRAVAGAALDRPCGPVGACRGPVVLPVCPSACAAEAVRPIVASASTAPASAGVHRLMRSPSKFVSGAAAGAVWATAVGVPGRGGQPGRSSSQSGGAGRARAAASRMRRVSGGSDEGEERDEQRSAGACCGGARGGGCGPGGGRVRGRLRRGRGGAGGARRRRARRVDAVLHERRRAGTRAATGAGATACVDARARDATGGCGAPVGALGRRRGRSRGGVRRGVCDRCCGLRCSARGRRLARSRRRPVRSSDGRRA